MVTKIKLFIFCRDHKKFYAVVGSLKIISFFWLTKYSGFRNWTFINVQKGKARDSLARKRRKTKPRILKITNVYILIFKFMDLFGENTLVFISILASTSHLILEVLLKLYGNRVWLNDLRFLWRFLACSGVFTIVFVHFKELLDIFSEKNMVTKFLKVFFGRDHKNFYGKENS